MATFYSKTTGGFYHSGLNATMPNDVVPVTDDTFTALMTAQSGGQVISADANGNPIATARPALTGNPLILSQIGALEATQTLRRMRDTSPAGISWLEALEAEIAALRATLT